MSSSKSSPKNTTTTTDYRTTNTLNAGLSGDISDALVAAGNYGDTNVSTVSNSFQDHTDNSLQLDMADYSDRSVNDHSDNSLNLNLSDNSDRSVNDHSSYNWLDNSDNSLNVNMSDTSNRSVNDYSDHSVTNVTDGGAFDLVMGSQKETFGAMNNLVNRNYDSMDNLSNSAFEKMDNVTTSAIDFVRESSAGMMDFISGMVTTNMENMAGLAGQSLAGAMNIKAGESISDPANQNLKTLAKAGVVVAGIGGLVYVMRKR